MFNRETISFSKPCKLTNEKQHEINIRNTNNDIDEPFPSAPEKMDLEFIECKNSEDDPPKKYPDFVQGIAPNKFVNIGGIIR